MARVAQLSQLRVGLHQDARQPVRQLGGDRCAVAPACLARAEHGLERGLDHVIAAAPRQGAVKRHKCHGSADPVGHRLRVGVGDVGDRDAFGVVANAGDRRGVGAKRGARQKQPTWRRGERLLKARAPRQLLAEVVGLVDDHERLRCHPGGPSARVACHTRIGDRHAMEVARSRGPRCIGLQLHAQIGGCRSPLARKRRRRAQHHHAAHLAVREHPPGQLQRRARLTGAGRRRDQERALPPAVETVKRVALPSAQRCRGRGGQRARHPAARVGRIVRLSPDRLYPSGSPVFSLVVLRWRARSAAGAARSGGAASAGSHPGR